MATPREITIIGGGIMGCTTAYYLTRHPSYSPEHHHITLLEAASNSTSGRMRDTYKDPAILGDATTASKKNPAHDGIAGGASGKAAGLLALWAFPSNIVPLSFQLHDELAREHGGDKRWGYRRCHAIQIECKARLPPNLNGDNAKSGTGRATKARAGTSTKGPHKDHKKSKDELQTSQLPADLDWVDQCQDVLGQDMLGTPENTAQVHPELFTRSMAQLAEDGGAKIITGARVTAINKSADGSCVESVTYEKDGQEFTLKTTDCVVAAGAWSSKLLPEIPLYSSRTHSVVVRPSRPISAYSVFATLKIPAGFRSPVWPRARRGDMKFVPLNRQRTVEPEIYARPDGTAYACGAGDSMPLPLTTDQVEVDEARCEDIVQQMAGMSDTVGPEAEILAYQACFLPHGGPFIGQVGKTKGLIVATGHNVWGIQNGPGTGKIVSELVFDGKAVSAELGECDPATVLEE